MVCVLIVDDDDQVVEVLQYAFSRAGYEVLTSSGGEEALELSRQYHFDLIVLDAMMPRVDGYQLLWHFKHMAETQHIPTIMLTSRTRPQDVDFGLKLGARYYMCKPFAAEDVLRRGEDLLKNAAATQH